MPDRAPHAVELRAPAVVARIIAALGPAEICSRVRRDRRVGRADERRRRVEQPVERDELRLLRLIKLAQALYRRPGDGDAPSDAARQRRKAQVLVQSEDEVGRRVLLAYGLYAEREGKARPAQILHRRESVCGRDVRLRALSEPRGVVRAVEAALAQRPRLAGGQVARVREQGHIRPDGLSHADGDLAEALEGERRRAHQQDEVRARILKSARVVEDGAQ